MFYTQIVEKIIFRISGDYHVKSTIYNLIIVRINYKSPVTIHIADFYIFNCSPTKWVKRTQFDIADNLLLAQRWKNTEFVLRNLSARPHPRPDTEKHAAHGSPCLPTFPRSFATLPLGLK